MPFPPFCYYSCLRAGAKKPVKKTINLMILFAFFLYCFFKLLSPFAPFTYTLHFQHPEKDYSPLEVVSPSKCSSIYLAVSSFSKGCILSLRQKHRGTTYSFFFFSFFFFFCHWIQTEQCFLEAWEPNSSWQKVAIAGSSHHFFLLWKVNGARAGCSLANRQPWL